MSRLAATGSWAPPDWSPRLLVYTDAPARGWFAAVLGCALVVLALAVVLIGLGTRRLLRQASPRTLLRATELGDLTGTAQEKRARSLRRLPDDRTLTTADRGIRLGILGGHEVWMSWEDVALVIMGPRSNKTSAVAVPAVLSAPGLVVATSNKSDLWALTSGPRAEVGPVWTFDPQQIAYAPQTWWWDPLRSIRDAPDDHRYEAAARLAGHFMGTIGGQRRDPFFHAAGEQVLTGTLLAAALGRRTMRDVVIWLQHGRRDAVAALDRVGAVVEAADLDAALRGADITAKGIYQTARTAAKALTSERILRWITPPNTWRSAPDDMQVELDPSQLLITASEQPVTAHLLSKEGAGTAAPVVAALVDRLLEVAEMQAQAAGGRLDPPVVAVLDEAANICPIQQLPQLYSHYGSRGIQVLTMLQSYQQGVGVWGAQGMDSLWSAATIKLVGAGVDDHAFLQRLSGLIGDHDVEKRSTSYGRGNGRTWQTSTTRQPILPPDALRALERTHAVLLTSGRRAGLVQLLPWYRERHAADISAYADSALNELRETAHRVLGALYESPQEKTP
ncbi:type IV secretory system conjugative DNA transfer family protein [Pseudonocardia lutea]|uniref:Type IV secretory system conjugative DNA transfer family protein n=1 Tax=Pseudonocardia lutea TaxID=2172015 RepID=A0ABW1IHB3_9PSEU